jgi:hypothetical protein
LLLAADAAGVFIMEQCVRGCREGLRVAVNRRGTPDGSTNSTSWAR